jgi:hypothetical protein
MIRQTRLIAALFVALAAQLSAGDAFGHEEGTITLAQPRATAGRALGVTGEKFTRNTSYTLVLKGALREYEITTVEADDAGAFALDMMIPADVAAGAYRLVVVAPDGDEVVNVDLEVEAGPVEAEEPAEEEAAAAHMMRSTPSADELVIERRWSGAEWFLVGALFGAALVGGVVLLRRPRAV